MQDYAERALPFRVYRFLERNTSLSTFSGLTDERRQVTTFPPVLKTLSEGELVAGIHKYLFASFASRG